MTKKEVKDVYMIRNMLNRSILVLWKNTKEVNTLRLKLIFAQSSIYIHAYIQT